MNAQPYTGAFYAVENGEGLPLSRGDKVLAFSSRELAQRILDRAQLAGGRIVRYAGEYEMFKFFEKALKLGAVAIMADEGDPKGASVRLYPQTWDWAKFRRARARAAGLELLQ